MKTFIFAVALAVIARLLLRDFSFATRDILLCLFFGALIIIPAVYAIRSGKVLVAGGEHTAQSAPHIYYPLTFFSAFVGSLLLLVPINMSLSASADVQASACPANLLPFDAKATPKLISDQLLFIEGPTWSSKNQAFYFSEMDFSKPQKKGPYAKIYQLTLPDTLNVYIEDSGTNGLWADEEGLFGATHSSQSLSRFAWQDQANSVLVDRIVDKHFNSPNDLVRHSLGHFYFTDPDWQLGERQSETGFTGVYLFKPDTQKISLIDASLNKPNGIMLSKDERTLFVGDVDGNINQYNLDDTGELVGKAAPFAKVAVPDGMAMDCAGNLYVTSHADGTLSVFNQKGDLLQKIAVAPQTTNVAFGGTDNKTLLITTGKGLYTMQSNLAGITR